VAPSESTTQYTTPGVFSCTRSSASSSRSSVPVKCGYGTTNSGGHESEATHAPSSLHSYLAGQCASEPQSQRPSSPHSWLMQSTATPHSSSMWQASQ